VRVFISGGCKNGKSFYGKRLAKAQQTNFLYYIATMKSIDAEDDERIVRHRKERDGWNFTTIEQPVDIEKILDQCNCSGSFLLDSVTALLANEMFLPGGFVNEQAARKVTEGLSKIICSIENVVIVSDYMYIDAVSYDLLTERYRKSLAEVDCAVAKICDIVLEVAYGNAIVHKGSEAFDVVYQKIC